MDAAILGYSKLVGVKAGAQRPRVFGQIAKRAEKTRGVISREANVDAMSTTAGA